MPKTVSASDGMHLSLKPLFTWSLASSLSMPLKTPDISQCHFFSFVMPMPSYSEFSDNYFPFTAKMVLSQGEDSFAMLQCVHFHSGLMAYFECPTRFLLRKPVFQSTYLNTISRRKCVVWLDHSSFDSTVLKTNKLLASPTTQWELSGTRLQSHHHSRLIWDESEFLHHDKFLMLARFELFWVCFPYVNLFLCLRMRWRWLDEGEEETKSWVLIVPWCNT